MAVYLVHTSVLVPEEASASVGACLFLVEDSTVLCFDQVIVKLCLVVPQFLVSMRKLAFVSVAATFVLDPVLAEFSFEPFGAGLLLSCTFISFAILNCCKWNKLRWLRLFWNKLRGQETTRAHREWIRANADSERI